MTAKDEGTKDLDKAPPMESRSLEEVKMRRALRVLDAWKLATGHPGMAPDLCAELCKAMEDAEAEASLSAELRRDVLWREALEKSHYEFHDGLHSDPVGHPFYCEDCAPLRALLASNASADASPPSVTDLTSSLTREREENQRLTKALRAADAEWLEALSRGAGDGAIRYGADGREYSWWECGNCNTPLWSEEGEAYLWGDGSGHPPGSPWDGCAACAPVRLLIARALTSGASAAKSPEKTDHSGDTE